MKAEAVIQNSIKTPSYFDAGCVLLLFEKPSFPGQGKAHYVIFVKVGSRKGYMRGGLISGCVCTFAFGRGGALLDGHAYQGLMPKACELQKKSKYGAFYEYDI